MKTLILLAALITTPAAAQSATDATNPTTAWMTGFMPSMQTAAEHFQGMSLPIQKGCQPVVVTADKQAPSTAGMTLYPATYCVKPILKQPSDQTKPTDQIKTPVPTEP